MKSSRKCEVKKISINVVGTLRREKQSSLVMASPNEIPTVLSSTIRTLTPFLAAAAWMALEPPACLTSTKKVSKNARDEDPEDASLEVRTL